MWYKIYVSCVSEIAFAAIFFVACCLHSTCLKCTCAIQNIDQVQNGMHTFFVLKNLSVHFLTLYIFSIWKFCLDLFSTIIWVRGIRQQSTILFKISVSEKQQSRATFRNKNAIYVHFIFKMKPFHLNIFFANYNDLFTKKNARINTER